VFDGGHPLEHYDWTVPTAVVLGNERDGVSEEAIALSDGGVYVSMVRRVRRETASLYSHTPLSSSATWNHP
jgi:hypothetical protein